MKIEDQVVGLELAQEMKELGAKQDSFWCWNRYITSKPYLTIGAKRYKDEFAVDGSYIQYSVSLYTVAELGEMLPPDYSLIKLGDQKDLPNWCCANSPYSVTLYYEYAEKAADAYAKMWLHIKKEGVI